MDDLATTPFGISGGGVASVTSGSSFSSSVCCGSSTAGAVGAGSLVPADLRSLELTDLLVLGFEDDVRESGEIEREEAVIWTTGATFFAVAFGIGDFDAEDLGEASLFPTVPAVSSFEKVRLLFSVTTFPGGNSVAAGFRVKVSFLLTGTGEEAGLRGSCLREDDRAVLADCNPAVTLPEMVVF